MLGPTCPYPRANRMNATHPIPTTVSSLVVALLTLFGFTAIAVAEPIITLNDEDDFLPDEAFFATNPTAVVNVESGGYFAVGGPGDAFDFGGATVNLSGNGQIGSRFLRSYQENGTFNMTGGRIEDGSTFAGKTGDTLVTMSGGLAVLRLTLQGNTRFTATGGQIGLNPPGGVPSLIAEGDSIVTIAGASVEDNVQVQGSASLVMTSGSIDHFMSIRDDAVVTVAGGVTRRALHTFDDSTLNINGGVVGREFTATERSVVNMSGGGLEQDAGVFDDAVFNLRGGAVEDGFRAFGGKMNIMGGVVGDRFRLGAPGRNGRDSHAEVFATSAAIDGLEVSGSRIITEREGQFLTADLVLGGLIGLELSPSGVDKILDESLLTLTIVNEAGDANGDGLFDASDYTVWRDNRGEAVPRFTRGDFDGSGLVDTADYGLWAAAYNDSLSPAMSVAVPEPQTLLLVALAATCLAHRNR